MIPFDSRSSNPAYRGIAERLVPGALPRGEGWGIRGMEWNPPFQGFENIDPPHPSGNQCYRTRRQMQKLNWEKRAWWLIRTGIVDRTSWWWLDDRGRLYECCIPSPNVVVRKPWITVVCHTKSLVLLTLIHTPSPFHRFCFLFLS